MHRQQLNHPRTATTPKHMENLDQLPLGAETATPYLQELAKIIGSVPNWSSTYQRRRTA